LYAFHQSRYLDNHWSLTKFCVTQFKGNHVSIKKAESIKNRQMLAQTKGYEGITEFVGEWTGEDEMKRIIETIESNPPRLRRMHIIVSTSNGENPAAPLSTAGTVPSAVPSSIASSSDEDISYTTPQNTQNPEPPSSGAPFLPHNFQSKVPLPAKSDPVTPTPTVTV
jgi:tRNA-dihydrouridine synthase 2